MEIDPVILILVIATPITYFMYIYFRKRNKNSLSALKNAGLIGFTSAVIIAFLVAEFIPSVRIIYPDQSSSVKYFLSDSKISTKGHVNSIVEIKDYEIKNLEWRTQYLLNTTNDDLVLYPALYGGRNKLLSDSLEFFPSQKLVKTNHVPDFYFEEPDYIEVKENFIFSIFRSIMGYSAERWILDTQTNLQRKIQKKEHPQHDIWEGQATDDIIM